MIDTNTQPALLEEILAVKYKDKSYDPRLRHKSFVMRLNKENRFKELNSPTETMNKTIPESIIPK